MNYETFSHGADIGIRGMGENLEQCFEMAAMALTAVVTDPKSVQPAQEREVHLHENDLELLFYDWINTLIYEMDTQKMLFSEFQISLHQGQLDGIIRGDKVDSVKHDPAVEIKGATFTELKVIHENGQCIAQCVVDV